jgi:hypothetical protein
MSLNSDRYLRVLPSLSETIVPQRIAAQFHSVSLQHQIDSLRQDITSLTETVRLVEDVVYRLVDLLEPRLQQEGKFIEALTKNGNSRYLHYI